MPEDMDAAAAEAEKEIDQLEYSELTSVVKWWVKHYPKAGHKRLGRILVKIAKEEGLVDD